MKKILLLIIVLYFTVADAQIYNVSIYSKIGDNTGGFNAPMNDEDWLGYAVENIGDLNGDGINDVAVGAIKDDDGGFNKGAVYILFLNAAGTVESHQKISNTEGGFSGILDDWDIFGTSISYLGDMNNDGLIEIGVGAEYDGDGGWWHGAIWILSLNPDGTVNSHVKISDTEGGFLGELGDEDVFGTDIELLGDLNGDGIQDIAVSARRDPDGGSDRGAVYILFLNLDFTVNSFQKISATEGNFQGELDYMDSFGGSVANIGDLNGDGVIDIAVGAIKDDDGGSNTGALYILFLNNNGTVNSFQKISDIEGGFEETFNDEMFFGHSIDSADDINEDGLTEIIVGASGYQNEMNERLGAFYILNLNANGTVNSSVKYSAGLQGFDGIVSEGSNFGSSVTYTGFLTERHTIATGAYFDNEGGYQKGSVWILQLGEILSIENIDKFDKINIYPNPSKNAFSLSDIGGIMNIKVFDVLGKEVIQFENISSNYFNVSYLPIGQYFIVATNDKNSSSTFKLIKE